MNKRLLVISGIFAVAVALTASIPLSQVKADHCHPSQGQTAATDAKEPVKTRTSDVGRQRTRANIALPESRPIRNGLSGSLGGPVGPKTASLEEIYSRDLPTAILSIGEAVKAIESGDRKTELAELNKAVTMLVTIHAALGRHVKPQFANNRCPIMDSPIIPDTVDASLTRDYKGQKIAFCCGGCPLAWDKLTDAEKQAKLPGLKS
jgi:hypothetical protein